MYLAEDGHPGRAGAGQAARAPRCAHAALRDGDPYLAWDCPAATSRTSGPPSSSCVTSTPTSTCRGEAIDAPAWHSEHFPISFWPRTASPACWWWRAVSRPRRARSSSAADTRSRSAPAGRKAASPPPPASAAAAAPPPTRAACRATPRGDRARRSRSLPPCGGGLWWGVAARGKWRRLHLQPRHPHPCPLPHGAGEGNARSRDAAHSSSKTPRTSRSSSTATPAAPHARSDGVFRAAARAHAWRGRRVRLGQERHLSSP